MTIFLTDTNQNKVRYILTAFSLSLVLAIISALIVFWLFQPEAKGNTEEGLFLSLFGYVIFAPLAETLLMIPIFKILEKYSNQIIVLSVLSAAIWGVLHSLMWLPWGAVVFFPFMVFSLSFQAWKKKSLNSAYWITFSVHSLHNLGAVSLGFIAEGI